MALFDVTRDLAAGTRLPFADDCVYVLRAPAGNVTVKVDSGVTREAAARLLAALGAGLEAENSCKAGNSASGILSDAGKTRDSASPRPVMPPAEGRGFAAENAKNVMPRGRGSLGREKFPAAEPARGAVTDKTNAGAAARLLSALIAGLGEEKAREAEDFAPSVGTDRENSPIMAARERGRFSRQAKSEYFERVKPLTFSDIRENGEHFPAAGVDPESVVEDLVRWGCGYAAYKLPHGRWWWVKWRSDTGERWGLSGPQLGAVEARKGPFDSFDETAASLFRYRFEHESAGERL